MHAARNGNNDIIRLLLNSGGKSSVSDTNRRSLTPLGEALVSGHTESASLLINEVVPNIKRNMRRHTQHPLLAESAFLVNSDAAYAGMPCTIKSHQLKKVPFEMLV